MADDAKERPLARVNAALRTQINRAVPSHFRDPFGLAKRVFRSGRDGRHAIMHAALGLGATPIDIVLSRWEKQRYRAAAEPHHPIILVCGPARSGTTLISTSLIRALPVTYFSNVSTVFPRAPITASRLFGALPNNDKVSNQSLYGRTAGFLGTSDALPLWDRWLGPDRSQVATTIGPGEREAMVQFFGAYEAWMKRPLVAKNNSLNAVAHLIAEILPTSHFICVDRDPVYLAQSLLVARSFIHGDVHTPYGLTPPGAESDDPVAAVIDQVRYHRDLADRQQEHLGKDRFWVVDYDEFCRDPNELVQRVSVEILGAAAPLSRLEPFTPSRRVRIDRKEFSRLQQMLGGAA